MRNLHSAIRGAVVAGFLAATTVVLAFTAAPAGAACGCAARRAATASGGEAAFEGTLTVVADPGLGASGSAASRRRPAVHLPGRSSAERPGGRHGRGDSPRPSAPDCTTPMVVGRRYEVSARAGVRRPADVGLRGGLGRRRRRPGARAHRGIAGVRRRARPVLRAGPGRPLADRRHRGDGPGGRPRPQGPPDRASPFRSTPSASAAESVLVAGPCPPGRRRLPDSRHPSHRSGGSPSLGGPASAVAIRRVARAGESRSGPLRSKRPRWAGRRRDRATTAEPTGRDARAQRPAGLGVRGAHRRAGLRPDRSATTRSTCGTTGSLPCWSAAASSWWGPWRSGTTCGW